MRSRDFEQEKERARELGRMLFNARRRIRPVFGAKAMAKALETHLTTIQRWERNGTLRRDQLEDYLEVLIGLKRGFAQEVADKIKAFAYPKKRLNRNNSEPSNKGDVRATIEGQTTRSHPPAMPEAREMGAEIIRQIFEENSAPVNIEVFVLFFKFVMSVLEYDKRHGWVPARDVEPSGKGDLIELRRRFLLGSNTQFSVLPGIGAPFHPTNDIHPASQAQLDSITKHLNLLDRIERRDFLDVSKMVGDWVSIGGPVNNYVARNILGVGGLSPLFSFAEGPENATPPVRFDITRHLARFARGEKPKIDWDLLVGDGELEKRVSSGDCILITSIPDPYQSNARALNIASMFAPGALALDNILQDWRLMENIMKRTKGFVGWQALIPVKVVDERPVGFEEAKIFQIRVDFDKLREVMSAREKAPRT